MNSENGKRLYFHRLSGNLPDKLDLKRSDKYIALLNLRKYYAWKNVKN